MILDIQGKQAPNACVYMYVFYLVKLLLLLLLLLLMLLVVVCVCVWFCFLCVFFLNILAFDELRWLKSQLFIKFNIQTKNGVLFQIQAIKAASLFLDGVNIARRGWRYQRGNHNP